MPPKKTVTKPASRQTKATPSNRMVSKVPAASQQASKKTAARGKVATGKNANNKAFVKQPPKKKGPTKEDLAAITIQKWARRFLSKRALQKMKKEKTDYDELMEKLEREAYVTMVKKEQERAELEREKEEEERRRKKAELKRRKRFLEAAFDGEKDELQIILQEIEEENNMRKLGRDVIGQAVRSRNLLNMIECEDANGNTPLSEAAGGGHADTIRFLIDRGADVNSQGQFRRTPLYRTAFGGHLEAAQVLLENGADPRIYANDGATPEQIASIDALVKLFQGWDISQTDQILEKIEKVKEERREKERARREAEMQKLDKQIEEAQTENNIKQKILKKAYEELEKRITEHDKCTLSGHKTDLTIQVVHDAEHELEMSKIAAEEAREKLSQLKLKKREQQRQGHNLEGIELPGVKVNIKELDDVLMRDVGGKMEADGRWPILIDSSNRSSTFLRYQDTNYLNALNPTMMQPEVIRMALLGALRYGKPFVIDMQEVDMFEACARRFDEVRKGFFEDIINKEIIKPEKYKKLIKETDGKEYNADQFIDARVKRFKFIVVMKLDPSDEMLEKMYPIRVVVG
ncbi:putative IQ motif and ankyrin repeat domain-containing protein [Anneissia japonica]|uniref:putative IQ motif and ankyrin repeat domain-containing protein n=1 Tax=Anneissia japonica TaxID=1529436 RepID=UPI001425879C|nr:putative IQ motif and ankyrin repeat domain-containing protein [Anneissia japonica]